MRRYTVPLERIRLLLLGLSSVASVLSSLGCSGIAWEYDFPAAESKARLEQKDLFVYFRSWHSSDCGKLEGEWLLSAPEVKVALKGSVNCWLEWDWSQEIARKYRLRTYPAFVVVRPNNRFSAITGMIPLERFLEFFERAKSPPRVPPATGTSPQP